MGKEGTIRILNLFTIMNRGGAETMVMNYYRKIDRTKVQFDFLVHREQKGAFDDEIKELGGKIYHICPIYPHNFSKYKRMAAQFLDEHPEYHIIHSHISELGYFMLKEAYKRNIPVRICHAHNTYYGWDLKMFVRIYFKLNIRKYVTHMFACSMDAGEWLFGKRNHDRIRVINNAIDTSLFQYKESVRENVRKELGIQGKFVIGNVGRFEKQKNHTFVIDVFKKICKKRDDAVLLLVGGGKLKCRIMKKAEKLHLLEKVIFLGERQDVHRLMQGMDVFLFPSLFEGFGIVVLEAQTAGVPCVVSDRVPDSCIITENVMAMDLKCSCGLWANRVIGIKYSGNREKAYQNAVAEGFDIQDNIKRLEMFYQAFGTGA